MLRDIPVDISNYIPEGTVFFFNASVPSGMTFASVEEKLEWMAKNGRLTMAVNVKDFPNAKD